MTIGSLPRLPSIRDLIKLYHLSAKSQILLVKDRISVVTVMVEGSLFHFASVDKIVKTASISARMTPFVVEIGPGPGLLSRSILDAGVKRLIAIEKDERFIPILQQLSEVSGNRLQVIQGDALHIDYSHIVQSNMLSIDQQQQQPHRPKQEPCETTLEQQHGYIMGNLPFNIASPLLLKFLNQQVNRHGIFGLGLDVCMNLMFQKEVGDRITADVSTSKRGRLSVMAQSVCNVKTVYKVPATVFVPKPKVDASVIQFVPKSNLSIDSTTYLTLENVLRYYFTKRRKTMGHLTQRLRKECPGQFTPELLQKMETIVDFKARPEDVTTEQFCYLSKLLKDHEIVQLPLI
ncbi:S-adenosyl-L-methionine-dependent methyltransferase [Mycotypha africana]|uniref:S-adenosyl-L-methionine-dependent methyltransferase n=1 Tax=Mycotypha africana TaxID=64632 RepID=UPI0022FFF0A6|nr:S-adenosyl-L-methionine-dependent methyltransferase [Mycotypha africana]KAI8975096.1 S-adenosyl-L-methionine-dependent methyltransferase [Mycotypha africana]